MVTSSGIHKQVFTEHTFVSIINLLCHSFLILDIVLISLAKLY